MRVYAHIYMHTYTHIPVCVYMFSWTFMHNYFRINNKIYFGAFDENPWKMISS